MAHSLGRGDQKTAAGFAQAALQLTILFFFGYIDQYIIYESAAAVLCIK